MLSKKVKLKPLHGLMMMIFLLGLLQPGLVLAADSVVKVSANDDYFLEYFSFYPKSISEWDLERGGVKVEAGGDNIPKNTKATLSIPSLEIELDLQTNEWGETSNEALRFKANAGTYPATITIMGESLDSELVVISDEDFYEETYEAELYANKEIIKKSETAVPLKIDGYNFPIWEYLDVVLNGQRIDTIDSLPYELDISDLGVGEYIVDVVHPEAKEQISFVIVPDEGSRPVAGRFVGVTYQHTGGASQLETPWELPIQFEVDGNGMLRNLDVEYWWVCLGQSGFSSATDIPATQINVNQPFELNWEEFGSSYTLRGIIKGDGTASGTFYAHSVCGENVADWNLVSDAPKPTPDRSKIFTDVSGWATSYIDYLAENNILQGKSRSTFAPNDNMTRAEFVTVLARMSGEKLPVSTNDFTDIQANIWYGQSVAWAVGAGITNGKTATTFVPNDQISRQEMAVMIMRYVDYKNVELSKKNAPIKFTDDVKIAAYAKEAVSLMQQAGIINGKGNNRFAPTDQATRAEAAKMVALVYEMEQ